MLHLRLTIIQFLATYVTMSVQIYILQESQTNEKVQEIEKILKQKDETIQDITKQKELLTQQKDEEIHQIIEHKDRKIQEIIMEKELTQQKNEIICQIIHQKDETIQEITMQKELLVKQKDEIIQQKEIEIQKIKKRKDEEIKKLHISLQEAKNPIKKISHKQGRKSEADKEMQTSIKSQQRCQERSTKNQQADVTQRNKVLLPDAEMCEINHFTEHVAVNKTVSMVITLRSSQGQPIINSHESISIKIMNTVTKLTTTLHTHCSEKDNGQYVLSFSITEVGVYKLQICFDDQKIFDNPFRYVACSVCIFHSKNFVCYTRNRCLLS